MNTSTTVQVYDRNESGVYSKNIVSAETFSTYVRDSLMLIDANALSTWIGSPAITTVGALNSGSITSGFGAIDIGADALTAGSGTFGSLRPILISGGNISHTAEAGGWVMANYFKGSAGTILSGFGTYGSDDALIYSFIGSSYASPWVKFEPTTTTFAGSIVNAMTSGGVFSAIAGTTAALTMRLKNTGSDFYLGIEGSSSGGFFTGSSAYDAVLYAPANRIALLGTGFYSTGNAEITGTLTVQGTGASSFAGDIQLASTKACYIGDPATDGTWRMIRSGNNLVIERRESGNYITKQTISA